MSDRTSTEPAGAKTSAGNRQDLILGVVIAAFGVSLLLWIIPAQIDDSGSFGLPPSLAPRALAWVITGLGLVLALQNIRPSAANLSSKLSWHDVGFLVVSIASVTLMLLIMGTVGDWLGKPYAGFLVAAPLGLIAFTMIHGGAPLWAYAFNTVVIPLVIYVAFWLGLGLPLP